MHSHRTLLLTPHTLRHNCSINSTLLHVAPHFLQNKKLKEVEASRFQLAEGAKRVDAKRKELMRQSEHQVVRLQALEKELDRQLGISDEQRRKVKCVGIYNELNT